MNRKTYWGIAALVIILIAAGGFMYWQWSSVQQLKEELAQDEKMLEEMEKPVAENKPPRPAREGYKWEWHGDHWHEIAADDEAHEPVVQNKPVEVFEPEPAQVPSTRTEGVYKEGLNGQILYYPPHPPFETYAHLLKDPEATLRKNAKIIVENYDAPEADQARAELNLLQLAISKGYIGGSMWSDEARRLMDLKEEVLWKPLEEKGILGPAPPVPEVEVVKAPQGGENQ
ncbi:MAG: hypothetical protein OXN27_18890 [Candidatus Poribacteria bacterium]|nr:hypothetical protein [Candidatus Poribacteria bacterium]